MSCPAVLVRSDAIEKADCGARGRARVYWFARTSAATRSGGGRHVRRALVHTARKRRATTCRSPLCTCVRTCVCVVCAASSLSESGGRVYSRFILGLCGDTLHHYHRRRRRRRCTTTSVDTMLLLLLHYYCYRAARTGSDRSVLCVRRTVLPPRDPAASPPPVHGMHRVGAYDARVRLDCVARATATQVLRGGSCDSTFARGEMSVYRTPAGYVMRLFIGLLIIYLCNDRGDNCSPGYRRGIFAQ